MRLFISINSQGRIFNQVTARSHTVIKFEAQLLLYKSMAQTGLLQENPQGCQDWYREVGRRVQRGLLRLYYNHERSPGQVLLLGSAGPAGPGLHPSRHTSSISHSIAKKIMSPPCKRRCKDACKWVLAPRKSMQAGHQLLGLEQALLPATSLGRALTWPPFAAPEHGRELPGSCSCGWELQHKRAFACY